MQTQRIKTQMDGSIVFFVFNYSFIHYIKNQGQYFVPDKNLKLNYIEAAAIPIFERMIEKPKEDFSFLTNKVSQMSVYSPES